MPGQSENPRMYMSYSWSSPEHEEWVRRLATELVESGVDVILDKWHLREGQDAHAFMERMVSDKTIKKVALVCDSVYAEKADNARVASGPRRRSLRRTSIPNRTRRSSLRS